MSDQESKDIPVHIKEAQRLIADIYGKLQNSPPPESIVMSMQEYQLLQEYRRNLGSLDKPGMDYLGRYTIFGIDISIGKEGEDS